jgi:XRE family transcriptional regulator, aerobic/anaerobic benzoate catabolism transcriptional regulator
MNRAVDAEALFLTELGQRVRTMRALHGMSRKVLSRASGVSERYLAQLESGQGNASVILLRRISAAMGARLEDLLDQSERPTEWSVVRELLGRATPDQVSAVKALLAGPAAPSAANPPADRVALIGLRGAGKSTLGRIVADELGWPFVELNREIESQHGLAVSEIFALYGQEGYRNLERQTLQNLVSRPGPMMLATAGGVVADPVTFDLVRSSFFTVWLKAKPEEHMRRVRQQGDLRPMGNDRSAMAELRGILKSREPLYAQARVTVDTSGLPAKGAAARLLQTIEAQVGRRRPTQASARAPAKRKRK